MSNKLVEVVIGAVRTLRQRHQKEVETDLRAQGYEFDHLQLIWRRGYRLVILTRGNTSCTLDITRRLPHDRGSGKYWLGEIGGHHHRRTYWPPERLNNFFNSARPGQTDDQPTASLIA